MEIRDFFARMRIKSRTTLHTEPNAERKPKASGQEPSDSYCTRLLEVYEELRQHNQLVAPLPEWALDPGLALSVAGLKKTPRLQAALADCTAYTPGKWLLEQELAARNVSPNGPKTWRPGGVDVFDAAHNAMLVGRPQAGLYGLALSGGGVRSATFALGVLQALADADRLSWFDYISSVSGGGYVHEWLASWIYANGKAGKSLDAVERMLKPLPATGSVARWPAQIQWLRRYSSYLTPKRGVLSLDTWTMICTWFRNTFLNQMVLFGFLATCITCIRLLFVPFYIEPRNALLVVLAIFVYMAVAAYMLGRAIYSLKAPASPETPAPGALSDLGVFAWIVLPCLLAACCVVLQAEYFRVTAGMNALISVLWSADLFFVLMAMTLGGLLPPEGGRWQRHRVWIAVLATVMAVGFAACAGWVANRLATVEPGYTDTRLVVTSERVANIATHWMTANAAGKPVPRDARIYREDVLGLLGPVLVLALQFCAMRLQLGVLGSNWAECRREWMARLGGWIGIVCSVWILFGFIAFFGPVICAWAMDRSHWHLVWVTLSATVLHAVTLYAGASGKADGQPKPGAWLSYKPLDLVGIVGAPLCILTLLLIIAGVVKYAVEQMGSLQRPLHVLWLALGLAVVFAFFGWRVDVNEFSMHGFYRNRLARCFLGATNMMRTPDPFTGFDEHAEAQSRTGIAVSKLLPKRYGGTEYDGPFPIFCSTLTLTFGTDIAYQDRKGTSFAFTPLYSGYHVGWTAETRRAKVDTTYNGYVPTATYAYRKGGIPLASAAAISGAALNPNQGVTSQPALAFLMTLFNVRLGWWIANPRKPKIWPASRLQPTPMFGLRYLLGELFGVADDTSKFVSLCDGGKFDNMGLYELVRRRCKLIVVSDAESDPEYTFEGIGTAIAKCRLDFGVEIALDLQDLRPHPSTGYSKAHYVQGTIDYPAPPGAPPNATYSGRILYVKSTVARGDELGDVLHFKLTHSSFPNDPTVNQWFTESQFESYRRLGQLSGEQIITHL